MKRAGNHKRLTGPRLVAFCISSSKNIDEHAFLRRFCDSFHAPPNCRSGEDEKRDFLKLPVFEKSIVPKRLNVAVNDRIVPVAEWRLLCLTVGHFEKLAKMFGMAVVIPAVNVEDDKWGDNKENLKKSLCQHSENFKTI